VSVSIIPEAKQARGQFNDGAILENKPIGFPREGGEIRPYSNLFYWAHAWTPGEQSLIGEHPHQGFEIMTFVLEGAVEHYDSKNKDWRKLTKGDVQIIRAGSGISHAERMHEASEMFQIWIDPNLRKTLSQPASYNDYRAASFPVSKTSAITVKTYHGEGSPVTMTTPGLTIKDITITAGEHTFPLQPDTILSAYVLEGRIDIDGDTAGRKDFVIVRDQASVSMKASGPTRIFTIESPVSPGYPTYADRSR
jgi:redox-sensitive bicupin YhaK (pirin superfamily)